MEKLDGKQLSEIIRNEVKAKVDAVTSDSKPCLALVQVGEDPASSVYVRGKVKACEQCGITSRYEHLPESISEEDLLKILKDLSNDPAVNGILLQLPIPKHINEEKAISTIVPIKDVDGFHPESLGLLASGKPRFVPCTPLGVQEMLIRYNIPTSGKHAVVVGRSIIVGKPMALLLSAKGKGADATVTICNSRTPSVGDFTRSADIVIAAIGRANTITADMVKEGVVVIDVGINRIDDSTKKKGYRLVGDVDYGPVSEKASYITPVPGGVGPMTIAMLMVNTFKAHALQTQTSNAVT